MWLPLSEFGDLQMRWLSALGRAVALAQNFEHNCKWVMQTGVALVTLPKNASFDDLIKRLEELAKKDLGSAIRSLGTLSHIRADDIGILDSARKARNDICHEGALPCRNSAREIVEKAPWLAEQVRNLAVGDNLVSGWSYEIEQKEPASTAGIRDTYVGKITDWVMAPLVDLDEVSRWQITQEDCAVAFSSDVRLRKQLAIAKGQWQCECARESHAHVHVGRCQTKGRLHLHQRVPKEQGGDESLGNCEALCEACHRLEHGFETQLSTRISSSPREAIGGNMEVDNVGTRIRQSKREIAKCAMLLLAVSSVLLIASWETIYYGNRAPEPLRQELLEELGRPSWHTYRYVTVRLRDRVDTGFQIVSKRRNDSQSEGKPVSDIVVVYVGDTPVICKIPVGFSRSSISGGLTRLPGKTRKAGLVAAESSSEKSMWGRALYYFSAYDRGFAAYVLFFFGMIGLAFLIYPAVVTLRWLTHPETHPIARSISRFGEFDQVAADIDNEMNHVLLRQGATVFLPSWIIKQRWLGIRLLRYDDLIWTHVRRTNEYTNWFYQGTSWTLIIYDVNGENIEVYCGHTRKKKADDKTESEMRGIEQLLREKAPWIIRGYSEEIARFIWQNAGNLDGVLTRLKATSNVQRT